MYIYLGKIVSRLKFEIKFIQKWSVYGYIAWSRFFSDFWFCTWKIITLTCWMYFKHAIPVFRDKNSYKVTVESFLLECNFMGNLPGLLIYNVMQVVTLLYMYVRGDVNPSVSIANEIHKHNPLGTMMIP